MTFLGQKQSADLVAILIPVLNPDVAFIDFLKLVRAGFDKVVVINDGSFVNTELFGQAEALGAKVLSHEANRGKGAAIKTGLRYVKDSLPEVQCVVTADADGQHAYHDVCKVAENSLKFQDRLIVGERTFGDDTPLASRFGNAWSKFWFRLLVRIPISDTQTGLRGIPRALFDSLLALPGERYEYETYMLVASRRHPAPPLCIPIETIYNDNNSCSHFRRIRDSLRTQFAMWLSLFRT